MRDSANILGDVKACMESNYNRCFYGYDGRDCDGCEFLFKELKELVSNKNEGDMTAEEAWELARKINLPEINGGLTGEDLIEIFGTSILSSIFIRNTVYDAREKIKKWTDKKINAGDVVKYPNGEVRYLVTRVEHNKNIVLHMVNLNNGTVTTTTCADMKKTGESIDLSDWIEL